MIWSRRGPLALLAASAVACGPSQQEAGAEAAQLEQEITSLLVQELDALQGLATGSLPLLILSLLGLAFGAWWISRWLHRWRRRRGFATGRLTVVAYAANVALTGLALLLGLRYLLARLPLIGAAILILGATGLLLVLIRELPAFIGGLGFILRRSINEGDRVTLGEVEGTVERVGVLRIVLRRNDGARTYVTLSALGGSSVTVASPRQVHPLEVTLKRARPVTLDELERLRSAAALCPYRAGASAVQVTTTGEGDQVVIRLQSWSAEASRAAERFLRRSLRADSESTGRS